MLKEFLNLQSKLRGLALAIKFKTYLLELEVQSRRHLLDYCVQWVELKKDRENDTSRDSCFLNRYFFS
jgi:hypothetical protein